MFSNIYLQNVLAKYSPRPLNPYSVELLALDVILRTWANTCLIEIKQSGSLAKGTAISLSSDVDFLISLSPDCNAQNGGLQSIYKSLGEHLSRHYTNLRPQNVSYRIIVSGLEIDITPARVQQGQQNWHSIYVSKLDSWKQTNIQMHINDVSGSGRCDEIKLLKIWRHLHGLEFPSIYLEYLTIEILKYRSKSSSAIAGNFEFVLQQLALQVNNPLNGRIVDPANTSNILSELISAQEKNAISNQARASLATRRWENIVW